MVKRLCTLSFFLFLVGSSCFFANSMEITPCFKLDSLPDELVSNYILGNIAISAFDAKNKTSALQESIKSIFNFSRTCKRYDRIVRDAAAWETILFPQLDRSHPEGMPALCRIAWCLPDGHWLMPSLRKYVKKQLLVEGEQSPQLDAQSLKMRLPWPAQFLKYPASFQIDAINTLQLQLLAMADCLSPHQAEKVLSGIMRVCKSQYDDFYFGSDKNENMVLKFLRRFLRLYRNSSQNTETMKRLLDHSATILDKKFTIAGDEEAAELTRKMLSEIQKNDVNLDDIRAIIENPFFDINRGGVNGAVKKSPLAMAVKSGNKAIVALLLQHGADPNVATIEGTPLEIAQSKGYQHIVELIEEHVRKLS